MTEEEKKAAIEAAERQAAEDAATAEAEQKVADEAIVAEAVAKEAQRDEEIAQLKKERDNYKTVALKRLGKLPGDADFLDGTDEKTGLTIEEQVRKTLLEREITKAEEAKDAETKRIVKENAELKLALKNRPGGSALGGESGGGATEVKDNVFSPSQLDELKRRAIRLNLDPQKYIDTAKANFLKRS